MASKATIDDCPHPLLDSLRNVANRRKWTRFGKLPLRLLLLVSFFTLTASAQWPWPKCSYHLPLFDAVGTPVPFTIVGVRPDTANINLLNAKDAKLRFVVQGQRLRFPEALVSPSAVKFVRVDLQIKGERGLISRRIPLNSCSPRFSLQTGELDSGKDVGSSLATGRLTGCAISGDWWIRMVPMFGSQEGSLIHEGIVRNDGYFEVDSSFRGQRHILVIGRDRRPLKAIGVNLTVGGTNNLGDVAMAGSCGK